MSTAAPIADAPYTATLKAGPGFEDPWLVIRASNETELELRLQALEGNTTFANLGRQAAAFQAQYQLGKQLGARGVAAPQNAAVVHQAPPAAKVAPAAPVAAATPAAPAAGGFFSSAPAVPDDVASSDPPMLAGIGPARFVPSPANAVRPWKAWADPRKRDVTESIHIKTDDPNDPRLATGEAKFWDWIRD